MDINQSPHEDEIEGFLRMAQEQGDESLRLSAGQLLAFFRRQYRESCSVPKRTFPWLMRANGVDSNDQGTEQGVAKDLQQLLVFLGDSRACGLSAWDDVHERVIEFTRKYAHFQRPMPKHFAGIGFFASDQSWSVFVTSEAGTPFYHIKLKPPDSRSGKKTH